VLHTVRGTRGRYQLQNIPLGGLLFGWKIEQRRQTPCCPIRRNHAPRLIHAQVGPSARYCGIWVSNCWGTGTYELPAVENMQTSSRFCQRIQQARELWVDIKNQSAYRSGIRMDDSDNISARSPKPPPVFMQCIIRCYNGRFESVGWRLGCCKVFPVRSVSIPICPARSAE
jgi:hypothetical protein